MASDDCLPNVHFHVINVNKIDGFIFEVIACEDIELRRNEEYSFPIDFEFNCSADYIGFIIMTHEKQENLQIKQERFSPINRSNKIDIIFTGMNLIKIKKGEKLGNLMIFKLSEEITNMENQVVEDSKDDWSDK